MEINKFIFVLTIDRFKYFNLNTFYNVQIYYKLIFIKCGNVIVRVQCQTCRVKSFLLTLE